MLQDWEGTGLFLNLFFISSGEGKKIVDDHNKIIASKRDSEIFFDAVMNPPLPNEELRKAKQRYDEIFGV